VARQAGIGSAEAVDVCIVGAGASGATAAKVLSEAGLRVVAIERGPFLQREHFSGDELKYINRNYLWPDPKLKPRTFRLDEQTPEKTTQFSPTPQAVGGGTLHWGGNIPRITPDDFRLRSLHGHIPGASLADWPIAYDDLEPYLTKVEYEIGASGLAGVSPVEGWRSKPYPNPPAPDTRYGRVFADAMTKLGHRTMPIPHAMLTRPYRGRPANPYTGYWQQYPDPTDSKSSAANTFIPAALATGRYELRTDCYAKQITTERNGRARGVLYEDASGTEHEQRAGLVILCCGGIETARLLLLSASSQSPDGLANFSGQVGRNVTFHEDLYAVGLFDRELHEPVYGWSGNYMNRISFDFYETDADRGHILGGFHFASMLGHPISWTFPGRPTWGQAAKDADRDFFNHSLKLGFVLHDLPRETNRVDLSEDVKDAWGLPVARITHTPHPNDYAQGRWHIDKNAEILQAAGASKIYPVAFDRITGNCCHEHGTARMGNDPTTSVVDAGCCAHDVPNLYVLDGSVFPTACGVTPTLTIMANAWRCSEQIVREQAWRAPRPHRVSRT
jgi:choline dehydrogenase-like flavoprotein